MSFIKLIVIKSDILFIVFYLLIVIIILITYLL